MEGAEKLFLQAEKHFCLLIICCLLIFITICCSLFDDQFCSLFVDFCLMINGLY